MTISPPEVDAARKSLSQRVDDSYGFGQLSPVQEIALRKFIEGHRVTDLGCGSGRLSRWLVNNGATHVYAVDSMNDLWQGGYPNVTFVHTTFERYRNHLRTSKQHIDVAFVSWPNNHICPELIDLLKNSTFVVCLSKNTDGISCGSPALYRYLSKRMKAEEYPHVANTLLLYPTMFEVAEPQFRFEEEVAGMLNTGAFSPLKFGALHLD